MRLSFFTFFALTLFSCSTDSKSDVDIPSHISFKKVDAKKSGINFKNEVSENHLINYYTFEYIFNGGGVAVGDINNDGLEDIYFTSNQGSNKLYINKGGLTFDDITSTAFKNVPKGWSTGANMVDINNDGLLDIYVCRSGWKDCNETTRKNLLFINNGDETFFEASENFGLGDAGYSINSSFFDYDNDGDLDCYITNHPKENSPNFLDIYKKSKNPPVLSQDHLYRNDKGKYTEVTSEAGITNYTFGLGLATADINNDGWVDVYGTSDFSLPDFLYLNQKDGTFKNVIDSMMGHISYFAMGVDVADINNDGLEDIFVTEMLPTDYERSKTNMASMNVAQFDQMIEYGLHRQYMHNTLQLNRRGEYFSEVANIAGVAKSDWSWGCLIEDFNNDGHRDIYIANGYKRDYLNQDFLRFSKNVLSQRQNTIEQINEHIPSYKPKNFIFNNNGLGTFKKEVLTMDNLPSSNSQGLAFSDLDNDGDLDIILNNLDEESYILENTSKTNNYLRVKLNPLVPGRELNAKIKIYTSEGIQYHEVKNSRGYQSTSSRIAHFGIADGVNVEKVEVTWLTGKVTEVKSPQINSVVEVTQKDSKTLPSSKRPSSYLDFTQMEILSPSYISEETKFDDYKNQVLLPHRYSNLGPFLSHGDINGDNVQDIFVGGSSGKSGVIYISEKGEMKLTKQLDLEKDKYYEDMGSLFFDFDNDGDLDLYVVSGGNEYEIGSSYYKDRLYINDGEGNFSKSNIKGLDAAASGSKVIVEDLDNDGKLELFVGGLFRPSEYPLPAKSFMYKITENEIVDISETWNINDIGSVSDAIFSDVDNDGDKDLITVGHWTGINVFKNTNNTFEKSTIDNKGWWNTIISIDVDNDGDDDYIVGNKGDNSKYTVSNDTPLKIYAQDFDQSGTFDVFLSKKYKDREVPVRGKECSSQQMPEINSKFETFSSFAKANIDDIISVDNSEVVYTANNFKSSLLINDNGELKVKELPFVTQYSEVNSIVSVDINKDSYMDVILGGNNFDTEAETSCADASIGTILINDKKGGFEAIKDHQTNLLLNKNVKDLMLIDDILFVANNQAELQTFKLNQ